MTTSPRPDPGKRVSLPSFDELVEAGAIVIPNYAEESELDAAAEEGEQAAHAPADEAEAKLLAAQSELEAETRRAKKECARLLEDAEREAMRVKSEAGKQAEEIKARAREELEETINARYEMDISHLRDTVDKTIEGFENKKAALFTALQDKLLDTCIGVAEDILHYELDRSADAYRSIVNNAVALLDTDESMTLRVPPVAYERLFGGKDNPLLRQMEDRLVRVVKDNDVKEGDALVVTDKGNIRVGAQTQSARLREAVLMKWGETP